MKTYEKEIKGDDGLLKFSLHISNDILIIRANSDKKGAPSWIQELNCNNYKQILRDLKAETPWRQVETIIENMFKGECNSNFYSSNQSVSIECTDKMITMLMGKFSFDLRIDLESSNVYLREMEEKYSKELNNSERLEDIPKLVKILRLITQDNHYQLKQMENQNNLIKSQEEEIDSLNRRINNMHNKFQAQGEQLDKQEQEINLLKQQLNLILSRGVSVGVNGNEFPVQKENPPPVKMNMGTKSIKQTFTSKTVPLKTAPSPTSETNNQSEVQNKTTSVSIRKQPTQTTPSSSSSNSSDLKIDICNSDVTYNLEGGIVKGEKKIFKCLFFF